MKKITITLLIFLELFYSCSTHKMTRSSKLSLKELKTNNPYLVPLDATIKENLIWKDKEGNLQILSEVSPDAVITAVTNLTNKLTAELKSGDKFTAEQITQISQSASELGKRTVAVSILRDALYRLEEFNINPATKKEINEPKSGTYLLFQKILSVADTIAQAEIKGEIKKAEEAKQRTEETKLKQEKEITKQDEAKTQVESIKLQQQAQNSNLNNRHNEATEWEEKGFNLLLSENIDGAIEAFQNAEDIYPTFHNVYEISRLLKSNKEILIKKYKESKDVYNTIINQYSWGMPLDIKKKLEEKYKK